MRKIVKAVVLAIPAACVLLSCKPTDANDAAAETAAGGIQLRHEARIAMQKERLSIARDKVTVEYEFMNESDKDVTTEVAFPIPAYGLDPEDTAGKRDFGDFRVWVESREVQYQTDARARLGNRDVTDVLRRYNIDVATFGNYGDEDDPGPNYQIAKLPGPARANLMGLGLIEKDLYPKWLVAKTYYWSQTFPAHQVLHVRHEYKPVVGFQGFKAAMLSRELKSACVDPSLEKKLSAAIAAGLKSSARMSGDDYVNATWVKYILTTANTWKGPIHDFELVVEKPAPEKPVSGQPANGRGGDYSVSFCWDGPVEHPDQTHFIAHKTDFVPSRELTVYFFPDY